MIKTAFIKWRLDWMLTNDQKYVLALLRASLASMPMDAGLEDEENVLRIIRRHGIFLTVYPFLAPSLQEKMRMDMLANAKHTTCQLFEAEQILHAITAAGLYCIPLKGLEQRKLYPKGIIRQMVDIDILVLPYDYSRVCTVMKSLGYTADGETFWMHDNFTKGDITVEIHKRLMDDSNMIRDWEKRMVERTSLDKDGVLHMKVEDQIIFHIIHMYKDFKNGALGLRRVVDVWLLMRQNKDIKLINQELKDLGLSEFFNRINMLSQVCMGEVPFTEDMEILLEHAFRYGIYGTNKTYQMGRIVSMSNGRSLRKGKICSLAAAIFQPVSRMKAQFPIVEQYPVLLPFFWIKRIVLYLHGDIRDYKHKLNYGKITEEDYEEMKRFFLAGGIKL